MNLFLCLLCSLYFFLKFLDVCLKVLRIFGKLRPCHDQVNIMVIICTTSGDMIPMENGLNYHALEPWNLLPYLKLNQETGVVGYSDIWPNGDVPLWWVAFLQEMLKHGSRFLPKNL